MTILHSHFWVVMVCLCVQAETNDTLYERAQSLVGRTESTVFRDKISPQWQNDNTSFWYRVKMGPESFQFVLVDPSSGDLQRAASLKELGVPEIASVTTSDQHSLEAKRTTHTGDETLLRVRNTSNESIEVYWVDPDGKRHTYGRLSPGDSKDFSTYVGHFWLLADLLGNPLGFFEATTNLLEVEANGRPIEKEPPSPSKPNSTKLLAEPNDEWSIGFVNHNVTLVSNDGKVVLLTTDGTEQIPYRGPVVWSPDRKHCVVLRVQEARRREVTIVESSPRDQLQPQLLQFNYFKPGDELPKPRPVIINVEGKSLKTIPDGMFENGFTESGEIDIRWSPRSDEFYFHYNQRGHQLYRVLAVNANTGVVRTIVEERSKTFLEWTSKMWHQWLDDSGELLWMSERDGWTHLWLIDIATGTVKNQVTKGDWVVRDVVKVDTQKRLVWFLAGGFRASDDPYYRQLLRVNFDGTNMTQLTQGEGDHSIEFSPDERFFIDRWSRVDQPPVTELRRSDGGDLIRELERADVSRLLESGWKMPERFVAKGRDGTTGIYGILIKPSNFDPTKKYPVVEEVYAGPHGAFTPKTFGRLMRQHVLAELGFIVVQADGMGTDQRGKVFHDVCWKNLEDAGFPDRIAWIKAAAEARPWMDISRVGIYGGSAGGQTAMRALIDHHDFYNVAVADCGCHDNRMDKIWWNEQWLGWPVDDSYVRSSNVEHANRIQGKLLLIVGELDTNVDPASTMQVVHALQKAGKAFEFMPIMGTGHGAAETPYGCLLRMDFLARHLLSSP